MYLETRVCSDQTRYAPLTRIDLEVAVDDVGLVVSIGSCVTFEPGVLALSAKRDHVTSSSLYFPVLSFLVHFYFAYEYSMTSYIVLSDSLKL